MPPFTPWSPLPLFEVTPLLGGGFRWWVAGGYAIELAVGRVVRPHGDVDVLLLRRDQLAAQQALDGWELWAADPPGHLRPWAQGEVLGSDVHDIWCRPGPGAPWRLQLMLDESSESGAEWMSRRDSSVRRAVASLGAVSPPLGLRTNSTSPPRWLFSTGFSGGGWLRRSRGRMGSTRGTRAYAPDVRLSVTAPVYVSVVSFPASTSRNVPSNSGTSTSVASISLPYGVRGLGGVRGALSGEYRP